MKQVERFFEDTVDKTKDFFSAEEMMEFAENYYQKRNKEKPTEVVVGPTKEEVLKFFDVKGYKELVAERAYDYYTELKWHDSKGRPIKNWKSKMIAVWFKEENRKPQTSQPKIEIKTGVNFDDIR